jgi:hypothetical protein
MHAAGGCVVVSVQIAAIASSYAYARAVIGAGEYVTFVLFYTFFLS